MITFSRSGVTVLVVRRTGVTIAGIFDSFYERGVPTPALPFFDGRWCPDGFQVWVGRHHLVLEFPALARALRGGARGPDLIA